MRVTVSALGWSFDVSLEPVPTENEQLDGASLDGGTTASTQVGYFARHDLPDEVAIHRPTSPWEDDSEARR